MSNMFELLKREPVSQIYTNLVHPVQYVHMCKKELKKKKKNLWLPRTLHSPGKPPRGSWVSFKDYSQELFAHHPWHGYGGARDFKKKQKHTGTEIFTSSKQIKVIWSSTGGLNNFSSESELFKMQCISHTATNSVLIEATLASHRKRLSWEIRQKENKKSITVEWGWNSRLFGRYWREVKREMFHF